MGAPCVADLGVAARLRPRATTSHTWPKPSHPQLQTKPVRQEDLGRFRPASCGADAHADRLDVVTLHGGRWRG